jgi:hypothetical protein
LVDDAAPIAEDWLNWIKINATAATRTTAGRRPPLALDRHRRSAW